MSQSTALSINALRPFVKDISELLQLDLFIKGVHCGHCTHKIEKALSGESLIAHYQVNEGGQNVSLYVDRIESFPKVMSLISDLGFEPIPMEQSDFRRQEEILFKHSLKQLAVAGVCAGNIMLFSIAIYLGAPEAFQNFFHRLSFVLSIPVLLYSAEPIWKGVWRSIKSLKFNLDLPIGLAVAFGFILSSYSLLNNLNSIYFDSLSVVIFIILCSRFLLDQYIKSIYQKNLSQCVPGVFQARLVRDGEEVLVSPSQIQKGNVVRVLRAETCPVDGELISAQAIMNLSVLTGESEPQIFSQGDKIYAGGLVCADDCLIRVEGVAEQTRVGQLVEASLKSIEHGKEESYRYVSFFTMFVVVISFISFVSFLFLQGASVAFQRAFAIIIVACPCAVSFGLPLIRMLSGQLCLKNGILVKRPQILKKILGLQQICFDKTGTLTESNVEINEEDFVKFSLEDQNILLSVELSMDHPISNGFKKIKKDVHELYEVHSFKYLPSLGIVGNVKDHFIEILSQEKVKGVDKTSLKKLYVYKNNDLVGSIRISSSVKKTTRELMKYLSDQHKKISLLSGDSKEHVAHIWEMVPESARGKFLFQATPEEKKSFISLNAEKSMMIGDGINDIAAIQKASVGVTMPGALENNLSIADISLLKGDLSLIKKIFRISQKVKNTERGLLIFTSLYNSLCILLAIFGYISPVAAAILMPISSLTVLSIVMINLRNV